MLLALFLWLFCEFDEKVLDNLSLERQPSRFLFLVVRALLYSTSQSCVKSRPMMSWNWTLWETGKLPCSSS